jgi:Protein of unknown function (DUF2971)
MLENFNNSSKYLYHYTSAHTALNHILKKKSLRFGVYTKTNDPKEAKTWQFKLGSYLDRDLSAYRMEELSPWLSDQIKGHARLLCFSTDRHPLQGDHTVDIFRRGFCKPRMWAQYAERHTGICLVLNRERLMEKIKEQIGKGNLVVSGPVKYVDQGIACDLFRDRQYLIDVDAIESSGRAAYPEIHLRTHWKNLFFEKMTDWRDEGEWRCVVFASSEVDLYVAYENALAGIVFGEDTSPEMIQSVIDITAGAHLRYVGLKWKNCSPWYDYAAMSQWRVSRSTS